MPSMPVPRGTTATSGVTKSQLDIDLSGTDTEDEQHVRKKSDIPEPVTEELVKKKRARLAKPLTEEMLTAPDGLLRIYEEFPKACRFRGRGSEAKDLKRLTTLYKEWAFQLHPGMAYQDFLIKCETLGSRAQIRSHLEYLRDMERSRYIEEVMGIKQVKLHPAHVTAPEVSEAPEVDGRSTQPIIQTQIATNDELALIRMMEELEQSGQLPDTGNNNTSSGGAINTASAAGPTLSAASLTTTSTVGDDQEEEEEDMSWLD